METKRDPECEPKKKSKSKEKSVLRLVSGLAGARFPVDFDIATEQVKQACVCLKGTVF